MKKLYNELESGSRKGGSSQWAKNIHLHALDTPKITDKKDLSIFKTGDHKKKKIGENKTLCQMAPRKHGFHEVKITRKMETTKRIDSAAAISVSFPLLP